MIVWISSYPKSGNTLTRAMIASYFLSNDGIFNFTLLENINQFPSDVFFKNKDINFDNEEEVIKNYIRIQESINKKNKIQFLKTHSCLFNYKNIPFTDLSNSLGVIYVIRDPRNLILSYANHYNLPQEESTENLINGTQLGNKKLVKTYTGNWSKNFNSWKSFKHINKYLLIKYEDLINDKKKTFLKILEFIHKIKKIDFVLDKKKFNNVIESTDFSVMKKMEDDQGFPESLVDPKTGKKIKFFFKGSKNDWHNSLNKTCKKKIEKMFNSEMKELGYL